MFTFTPRIICYGAWVDLPVPATQPGFWMSLNIIDSRLIHISTKHPRRKSNLDASMFSNNQTAVCLCIAFSIARGSSGMVV